MPYLAQQAAAEISPLYLPIYLSRPRPRYPPYISPSISAGRGRDISPISPHLSHQAAAEARRHRAADEAAVRQQQSLEQQRRALESAQGGMTRQHNQSAEANERRRAELPHISPISPVHLSL